MLHLVIFRRFPALGAVFLGALFLLPAISFPSDPHDFSDQECINCHHGSSTGFIGENASLKENISSACVNCHDSCGHWRTHDDGRPSPSAMGTALPLRENGQIACFTCHDPHRLQGDDEAGIIEKYLRMSNLKRELCINCHRAGGKNGRAVITSPPDRVVIREDYFPLFGTVEDVSDSHVRVDINSASFLLPIRDGKFYTWLKAGEGVNIISLSAGEVMLWKGEVFGAGETPNPNSYERTYSGHQTEDRNGCLGCHLPEDGVLGSVLLPSPLLCYRCHDQFNEKRFLHGPLAVGECLSCHNPHGGVGNSHLRMAEVDLCLSCHDTDEVYGHNGGKEALSGGLCSECHDPHQSDTRFLTREASLRDSLD